MQLSLSHLGYLPGSPKTLTLSAAPETKMPDVVPFYLRQNCFRMARDVAPEEGFSARFPSPYDLLRGQLKVSSGVHPFYQGELIKNDTRWGAFWQADFSSFTTPGSYQIETEYQISVPFAITEHVYDRIILGYLTFLRAQRCGQTIFGVHAACHLDDGVLDSDHSPHHAVGGWHDAGDFRKWLAFTLFHVEALSMLYERSGERLSAGNYEPARILEEITWGNRFFHRMISNDGQVYEDLGGGQAPSASHLTYESHWWFENHPGCYADASDNRWTDNLANSGDERLIRTTYNPFVQWSFVQVQARASTLLPADEAQACLSVARKAASFARQQGHDHRTLFLTAELRANLELLATADGAVDLKSIYANALTLMSRQEPVSSLGLYGYFLEADRADAYRSIAFSADPAFALFRIWELRDLLNDGALAEKARQAVQDYINGYLLADSTSNPFSLTPYGVYLQPPHPDRQTFRDIGSGRRVRTFIHPFNDQGIVHGTSSVLVSHAHLLARASVLFDQPTWRNAAERLLHWCLGHNPLNRSLITGIGYRQPIGYSFRIPQLPEAMLVGFIGRPDDSPYLEESTAIEWNTLEYWSMPYIHAAMTACWLGAPEA
jgi:hypothetical protein